MIERILTALFPVQLPRFTPKDLGVRGEQIFDGIGQVKPYRAGIERVRTEASLRPPQPESKATEPADRDEVSCVGDVASASCLFT